MERDCLYILLYKMREYFYDEKFCDFEKKMSNNLFLDKKSLLLKLS